MLLISSFMIVSLKQNFKKRDIKMQKCEFEGIRTPANEDQSLNLAP
jgi:hypothetical protein